VRVFVGGLPDEEHRAADHLNILLGDLASHVDMFRSAVRLFDHCYELRAAASLADEWFYDKDRNHDHWIFIAAKAAAMEIFHFGIILKALRGLIGQCPTVAQHVDHASLKLAQQLFESRFPRAVRVRHAISHASEMLETPEAFDRNFRPLPDNAIWLVSGILERTIQFTHENERLSVEVSDATLAKLEGVAEKVFDAIRPAMAATFEMPLKHSQPLAKGESDHQ